MVHYFNCVCTVILYIFTLQNYQMLKTIKCCVVTWTTRFGHQDEFVGVVSGEIVVCGELVGLVGDEVGSDNGGQVGGE